MQSLKSLTLAGSLAVAAVLAPGAYAAPPGMPEVGMPFGNHFAAMKARLNLNPTQDAQYTVASQATVKAIDAMRRARAASGEAAKVELNKPDPDFGRLLALREEAASAASGERRTANAEWVKFAQLLTTEQKTLVKSQLLDRINRADSLRDKFRQRHGG